jgi:Uncharacterised nucleotidyltransferase
VTGRLWPDAQQALLLRAGLCAGPAAVEAWEKIEPRLDLGSLDRGSARLLPLVWSNLHRQGVDVEALAPRYRQARETSGQLMERLGALLAPLHDAGIPTMLLKGAALLVEGYADLGERPMTDLDVLVPYDRAAASARALKSAGYTGLSTLSPSVTRYTHAASFRHERLGDLDLHWHVFEECCRPADDEPLWAAAVAVTVGGARTHVPPPEDQLLHACVHGEKWVLVPGVRWIADAVTLIRRGQVRWDRLVSETTRRRFVLRMRGQLAYLRSAFDAPIPGEAFASLARAPVSRVEHLEQQWGVRDRRRPWALVYWCNHLRSADGGVAGAAVTFPRHLQAVWRLDTLGAVPAAGLRRLWRSRHAPG